MAITLRCSRTLRICCRQTTIAIPRTTTFWAGFTVYGETFLLLVILCSERGVTNLRYRITGTHILCVVNHIDACAGIITKLAGVATRGTTANTIDAILTLTRKRISPIVTSFT
jgi:hypothetical protein